MKYQNALLLMLAASSGRGEQVEIRLESDPAYPRLPFIDVRFIGSYTHGLAHDSTRMLFHTNEFYMVHPALYGEEDSVPVGFNSQGHPVMQPSVEAPFVVRDNYPGVPTRRSGIPLYYGSKKSSGFASEIGSFILTPSSDDNMRLIVRPDSPQEFCNEEFGPIIYVPTTSSGTAWTVMAIVRPIAADHTENLNMYGVGRLESFVSESTIPYHISSGDAVDRIPYETFEMIKRMIRTTGAIIDESSDNSYGLSISNCTTHIESFPSIQYSLYARRDIRVTKIVDIVLDPHEYTTIVSGGNCIAHLAASSDPEAGAFGMNLLRSTAMHFDRDNNRVGLCDFRDM